MFKNLRIAFFKLISFDIFLFFFLAHLSLKKTSKFTPFHFWIIFLECQHLLAVHLFDLTVVTKFALSLISYLFQVLCLHLKRFKWVTSFRQKLETYIEFPLTDLDMNKYILDMVSERENLFQLRYIPLWVHLPC